MALTYKLDRAISIPINEGWHIFTGKVSLDSSYPAGGYTVPKALRFETRFKSMMGVMFIPFANRTLEYTRSDGKIRLWISAGMEATPGTDVSFISDVPFFAWGYSAQR